MQYRHSEGASNSVKVNTVSLGKSFKSAVQRDTGDARELK